MPNGYDEIRIEEHYVYHNGHYDFHPAHIGYIQSGTMPQIPENAPAQSAPDGYNWIGLPRHYDYHNGHYDLEEAHWALAKEAGHDHH